MNISENIDDSLMLCIWRSLIGEIYEDVIAIAVAYDREIYEITIRFYLNREPNDYDEESIDTVANNVSDYCPQILHYKLEFECIQPPLMKVGCPEKMELVYIKQGYEVNMLMQ